MTRQRWSYIVKVFKGKQFVVVVVAGAVSLARQRLQAGLLAHRSLFLLQDAHRKS
jgi:hypothetical protein